MNTKYLWAGLLLTLLAALPFSVSAQIVGLDDQEACTTTMAPLTFTGFYFTQTGVTITDFEWESTDVTLIGQVPGFIGGFIPYFTSTANADYYMTISQFAPGFYEVTLEVSNYPTWFDNLEFTLRALDTGAEMAAMSAFMYVSSPPVVTLVSPLASPATVCEGETINITTSVSGLPDDFQWQFNGVDLPGEYGMSLSILNSTLANSGNYQLISIDLACGLSPGPIVNIEVVASTTITDVDMAPKPCNPGETVTFQATALNIDNLSTYTWVIGGTNFTTASLPATVIVNGNTLRVNSIVNTPLDMTSTTSVVTIENISAPGAPSYTADVSLEVGNNTACVATTATVMSGTSSVFPVEWLDFQVKARDQQEVELHWATASETNNANFLIERATDAKTFRVVGELAGKGTTSTRQDYYFVDDKLPAANQLSYRIKQVDFDGAYSYSELRNVALDAVAKVSFTRVAQRGDLLELEVFSPNDGPAALEIFDARGASVYRESLEAVQGYRTHALMLPAVSGFYVLRFTQGAEVLSRKVIRN